MEVRSRTTTTTRINRRLTCPTITRASVVLGTRKRCEPFSYRFDPIPERVAQFEPRQNANGES